MKAVRIMLAVLILTALIVGNGWSQTPRQSPGSGKKAGASRSLTLGDYRFHYSDQGTGDPVVVLDAGLCQPMDTWGDVSGAVAAFTRVFAYDRVGLGDSARIAPAGKSPRPPEMRTSQQVVQELRDLLRKAGLPAPYVLVGHSFGGVNVRLYASQYPHEVAGIVLIDSSQEEEYSRSVGFMPPERRQVYTRTYYGGNCEGVNLSASSDLLRAAAPLPHVPLVVLTALGGVEQQETLTHLELQADLARRAPNSDHLIVERSRHFIQRDRPDAVIEAIRSVVERARPYPIPLPTEDDLKQTRILHVFTSTEAVLSEAALALSGLIGWRWRKRKRKGKAELSRAQRRQALRKEKEKK